MRRFTRLTSSFSKKLDNHIHALALYFAFYNFCRIHKTLRMSPAMELGLTEHVWTIEELIEAAANPNCFGPIGRRIGGTPFRVIDGGLS